MALPSWLAPLYLGMGVSRGVRRAAGRKMAAREKKEAAAIRRREILEERAYRGRESARSREAAGYLERLRQGHLARRAGERESAVRARAEEGREFQREMYERGAGERADREAGRYMERRETMLAGIPGEMLTHRRKEADLLYAERRAGRPGAGALPTARRREEAVVTPERAATLGAQLGIEMDWAVGLPEAFMWKTLREGRMQKEEESFEAILRGVLQGEEAESPGPVRRAFRAGRARLGEIIEDF